MSLFIVLVGFNASGKTTLAKKLEADLGLNIVSGDPLRLLIKQEILYFHDFDISIPTQKGIPTREVIHQYRKGMSKVLLSAKQSVIYDSNALKKADRLAIFQDVTNGIDGVTKVIIHVDLPEQELIKRLQARPEENWVEHYELYKKPTYEQPTPDECDKLLVYNQDNYDEIRLALKGLL
ncbi:MAG: hypothetical protein JWO47_438 [Candidatus Saccharibacteria bacterium]|nr:hypothetical protein [Candidatus Saccharibacteria bacterium]